MKQTGQIGSAMQMLKSAEVAAASSLNERNKPDRAIITDLLQAMSRVQIELEHAQDRLREIASV